MGTFFFFGEASDAVLGVFGFCFGWSFDTGSAFRTAFVNSGSVSGGKDFKSTAGAGCGSDTGSASAAGPLSWVLGLGSLSFSHWTILGVNCL
jgi:hypothetical protein